VVAVKRLRRAARRIRAFSLPDDLVLADAVADARRVELESPRHEPQIPADGLVLEIGAGQAPYARASLVVDKYVVDDFERPGEQEISFAKPLVVADGEHLPFEDRAFDYVIASHVLEHASNPSRFAAEMSRVAAAGFVQVPSREAELTFGWDFHPWLIDRQGDRLIFHPRGDAAAPVGKFFHEAYGSSPLFRTWFASVRNTFHHSVEWKRELPVETLGDSSALQSAVVDIERTTHVLTRAQDLGLTQPLTPALRTLLRCPGCGGHVRFERDIACACGAHYRLAGDVPILLLD
jgi:hypothetical protein